MLQIKGLALSASLLFATFAERRISVADKGLREQRDSVGVAVADAPLPPLFL